MRISRLVPEHPQGALEFRIATRLIRGKLRTIAEPSPALKELHLELLEYLEDRVEGISLSPLKNLWMHRRGRFFFQTDLKDAFPSVKTKRLAGVLCTVAPDIGDYTEVVEFLEKYCMLDKDGGLAQGAPASSLLFELYCRWTLDRPIKALLKACEGQPGFVVYTRYVDDLTFSSQEKLGLRLQEKLKRIIRGAGFKLQDNKTSTRERGKRKIIITGGRLPPGKLAELTTEFYQGLERQLNAFLCGELSDKQLFALRGSLAWYYQLESQVAMKRRGRFLRRVHSKAERARELLRGARRERRRFPKEWLEQLREKVEIIPYIRSELSQYQWAPKAIGIRCPCPFCNARGQTFTASPVKRSFHCHKCRRHGDVIAFARLRHQWTFTRAVTELARLGKLPLPQTTLPKKYTQLSLFPEADA